MSVPVKHHYLPKFYQSAWAGADGLLYAYSRPGKRVIVKRKHPSEVAYEPNLYAIASRKDAASRQELESGLFSYVDTKAAGIIELILVDKITPRNDEDCSHFSRFVMSLLHRGPDEIKYLKRLVRENDEKVLSDIASSYSEMRAPSDPLTYTEWFEKADHSIVDELTARFIHQLVDSQEVGTTLNEMNWSFVEFNSPVLLTSDAPVVYRGLKLERPFVLLPLSPSMMFLATRDRETYSAFINPECGFGEMARRINIEIIRQASYFVIASNQSWRDDIDTFLPMRGQGLGSSRNRQK